MSIENRNYSTGILLKTFIGSLPILRILFTYHTYTVIPNMIIKIELKIDCTIAICHISFPAAMSYYASTSINPTETVITNVETTTCTPLFLTIISNKREYSLLFVSITNNTLLLNIIKIFLFVQYYKFIGILIHLSIKCLDIFKKRWLNALVVVADNGGYVYRCPKCNEIHFITFDCNSRLSVPHRHFVYCVHNALWFYLYVDVFHDPV